MTELNVWGGVNICWSGLLLFVNNFLNAGVLLQCRTKMLGGHQELPSMMSLTACKMGMHLPCIPHVVAQHVSPTEESLHSLVWSPACVGADCG